MPKWRRIRIRKVPGHKGRSSIVPTDEIIGRMARRCLTLIYELPLERLIPVQAGDLGAFSGPIRSYKEDECVKS